MHSFCRIAHQKKVKGLSLEEVKQILSSTTAERDFAEHIINQEVRSRKVWYLSVIMKHSVTHIAQYFFILYTGQAAELFKDLVERHLKIEHGIPVDKYL